MKLSGLTSQQVEESRRKYGANTLTEIPSDPLWKKILEGFKDPMLMILMVALAVQVALFFLGQAEWFEPVGILIAILVANGVASVSENKQEGKASALKAEEEAKETAKVIRDGRLSEIHVSEVVVGDIVFLQAGDKIPADGVIAGGEIKVDQAALNGETEEAEKTAPSGGETYDIKDLLNRFYAYRGTVVCGGEAHMEVKVVGDKTLFGELALEVQEDTRETPLQVKLGKLANQISTFGYIGAIAIVIGVLAKTLLTGSVPSGIYEWIRLIMDAVTVAVTIIVCAVPEGLPMLTSILLSFQSLKMAKDNVLVRKINGLETAGSLSILFSDKTGTITKGHLEVVEFFTADGISIPLSELPKYGKLKGLLDLAIGKNTQSMFDSEGRVIGGNATDQALVKFLGADILKQLEETYSVTQSQSFNSANKFSQAQLRELGKTFYKGAPEKFLAVSGKYLSLNGDIHVIDSKQLSAKIDELAGRSMRVLAFGYSDKEMTEDQINSDTTVIGFFGIRDDVRPEAREAIAAVQNAGIQVVMITGDRLETAVAIAKDAGLLKTQDDVALTSSQLSKLSDDEVKEIIPRIRVIARALPTDKSRMVRLCQEMNLVVGMTGDGVNDSPALKRADVGFAMGSGTEAAKEAGKIVILDDNFKSIKDAIWYGRTIYHNILKFCKFQLVINVAAVVVSAIAPFFGVEEPLKVTHLLFVNLVMDGLGAIMLGNEPAREHYMSEKPRRRDESIVSRSMMTQIVTMGIWLTALSFVFLKLPFFDQFFATTEQKLSAYFVLFIWAALFNGFNVRDEGFEIFKGLNENTGFLKVFLTIILVQAVIVNAGLIPGLDWVGSMFSCVPFGVTGWCVVAVLAVTMIPVDLIRKAAGKRA